ERRPGALRPGELRISGALGRVGRSDHRGVRHAEDRPDRSARGRPSAETGERTGRQSRLRQLTERRGGGWPRRDLTRPMLAQLAARSAPSPDGRVWTFASLAIAAIVLAPVAALVVIAAQGSGDLW